jgi:ParB family chromosome partitioning protein
MLRSSPKTQLRSVKPSVAGDQKPPMMIEIDPARCRPWSYHNRDQAWLTWARCSDLIASIQKNGQIEPVIVRALESGSGKDFEIIAGVRRWFSCSQIPAQKLLVRVIEADDRSR